MAELKKELSKRRLSTLGNRNALLQPLKEVATVFDEPEQGERVRKDPEGTLEPGDSVPQVALGNQGPS